MNNDYQAFKANHSSMNSNNPNAKRISSNYNKRIIQGNKQTYFDPNNENSPYQNNQFKRNVNYSNNQKPFPNPYDEEIIRGYYINSGDERRFRNENGREEEIEIEENLEMENGENILNDGFIGDGEYVRNDMTNENNYNYSPNQNGQDLCAYYNLRNVNNNNKLINKEYNYELQDDPEEIEEENDEYLIRSPEQDQNNNYRSTQYNNFNNKVYQKRHILGNLKDSASSEAYANKNNSRATLTDYRNSGIYIKPKTSYKNTINKNNGISTKERGIESLMESTKKVKYGNNYEIIEESPIFDYPKVQQIKGGKVDLNLSLSKLKNSKKKNKLEKKEKYDMIWYENNLDKIVKIQATFRYYRIKKIMDKYHDCDEFIFHISKVQFNHFYDNFYFFINQLFNAYKAKTLGTFNLENNQEEKLEQEEENDEEENNEESDNEENKSYEQLLNDYTNLKKKYNALKKTKNDNNTNNNQNNNNNNSKSSFKKFNPELSYLPGETTFGSIKTDTHKFRKFKAALQNNNNNSTSNIKSNDNLTISNYNDDDKYERHFYTPDHYDDEDSYNEMRDKRYSYSSVHSDEYSKYFDNEQPKHRLRSFNNKKTKGIGLSRGTRKNKVFEYSPSFEIEKPSRDNSYKRFNNRNEIQNEKISNLSVINVNRSEIEDPEDIINKKRIEEKAYDKYVNNYSKDLRIVKNNKIILKSQQGNKIIGLKNFDDKLIFKENENIIHLKAQKKTDEQKMKDIFDNKRLYEKLKSKIEKDNNKKYRHNNIIDEEKKLIPNIRDNRFKLLQKSKRTKDTYLSIEQMKEKDKNKLNILKESNENNFEIKSEYYYVETKDSMLPEIIEKKIKESNIHNQPIINKENEFKENKTILSSESNFDIKGKKPEYLEDIESNELIILNNENKIKKKKNEVKKNEDLVIFGEPKQWNLLKDLNPILNNEFSLNKEKEKEKKEQVSQTDKVNDENLLFIETNELQVINNLRKTKKKEKEDKRIIKKFDVISPIKNQELMINKGKLLLQEKQLFKCNENNIKIKPIKKPKVREIKINTKKILKHEKILSRKKFLKTQYTSENTFSLKGNKTTKTELGVRKNEEFLIKREEKKTKEEEIQVTEPEKKKVFENVGMEEIDEIRIESKNKDFLKQYIKYLRDKNEKMFSVIASNQVQINSDNKKRNVFNNLNIGKDIDNEIFIKNKSKDILRAKKKEKESKIEIRQNLIEQFTFKGIKNSEKRIFTNLDIKKCEGQNIKAIRKEKKNLEKIKNEELIINKKEKEIKEIETQIEPDLINNNLVLNNDIKYKINPLKKGENIIVKNKSINIKHKKNNKSNLNLTIVKQKKLDLLQKSPKKFKKENLELCPSETIAIKTRESYEDPMPNYRLAKKFTKFLLSDNENLQPQNNINLISTLSETNENQFEIIGKKNEIIQENKENEEEEEIIQKPLIDKEMINKDLEKNMTKQFINNMVQNKLEIEKKKRMDNTKNKLITIFKAVKMKNALSKNNKNKKYFLEALKNIKKDKLDLLIRSNTFSHNYLPKDITKKEEFTETFDLKDKNLPSLLYIENNTFQIKNQKGKIKRLLTEIQENNINIEGIKNNYIANAVQKVDKEVQMSPKKEVKITMKKTLKKEKFLKKKFTNVQNTKLDSFSYESEIKQKQKKYIDNTTQTPKLRPKNKSPMKVIFNEIKTIVKNKKSLFDNKKSINYEINHTLDLNYSGRVNYINDSNSSIKIEKEDIKDPDKVFRISKFNKFFKYYFDLDKKISILQLICLIKWNHLCKNTNFNKSENKNKNRDIKIILNKYKALIAHKFLDFSKKYKKEKAILLMINLFNRRKKEMLKLIKMNNKVKKMDVNILRKNKIALHKLNSILRKYCGKYVFSLYKKNK